MKVLIATKNQGKIEGARKALLNYFDNVEIEVVHAPSEVPEMPKNDEISQGTRNRIKNLKKYARENNIKVDYYVAVESGIDNYFDSWMITSVAGIENDEGLKSYSTSPSYPIPEAYVDSIIEEGLGVVMDRIFADDDSGHSKGGIGFLTHGKITRRQLLYESFMMALIRIINDNW